VPERDSWRPPVRNMVTVDAADTFIEALSGVERPPRQAQKRKIIGRRSFGVEGAVRDWLGRQPG